MYARACALSRTIDRTWCTTARIIIIIHSNQPANTTSQHTTTTPNTAHRLACAWISRFRERTQSATHTHIHLQVRGHSIWPLWFSMRNVHTSLMCVCVCARSVRPFRGPRGVCGVYVILLLFQPARARKFFAIHTHMCMRVCACVLCESNNKCSISRIYGLNLLVRRCYTENDSDTRMHMFFFFVMRAHSASSTRLCDAAISVLHIWICVLGCWYQVYPNGTMDSLWINLRSGIWGTVKNNSKINKNKV